MAIEIKVPAVGESISEVQIGEWYVAEGDWVEADSDLVGLETDKATFDVPAPANGKVTRILKKAGEMAAVGDLIGYFEEAEAPSGSGSSSPKEQPAAETVTETSSSDQSAKVMPAAAKEMAQRGLSADQVTPTGPGGRILKEDVLNAEVESPGGSSAASNAMREEEIVPLSPIRKRIAERLVEAQNNAALLTTFNEIDMSKVIELRTRFKEAYIKKYDIKLGFMSFFVKGVVDALNQVPQVAAQMKDDHLIYRNYYDIGVAVGGGKGLVVPVIRNAERLSFAQIEKTIADFGQRARKNKINLDEMEGGNFTITNGGIYGSLLSTPIVNPPQSGVLGMHGIFERPIAVEGEVVIRPMMYVALTYDHRVVDGREAVTFLKRLKDVMEEPSRMLLEI